MGKYRQRNKEAMGTEGVQSQGQGHTELSRSQEGLPQGVVLLSSNLKCPYTDAINMTTMIIVLSTCETCFWCVGLTQQGD